MSMTFVVGTGRTGTRSLMLMFSQLRGVQALHEPPPELYSQAWQAMRGTRGEWLKDRLRSTRQPKEAHYVEASHWFCWLAEEILGTWPDSKIVWLWRDIKSWAVSAWRKGWYHSLADGRRSWAPYIRPEPKGGWDRGVSRWTKLGYLYERVAVHLQRLEQVTRSDRFRRFAMADLNHGESVDELRAWCGLPKGRPAAVRVNKGSGIITLGELQQIGVDLKLFGIYKPDRETLEDIVAVEELRKMGVEISSDWRPPKMEITARIESELNRGRALANHVLYT